MENRCVDTIASISNSTSVDIQKFVGEKGEVTVTALGAGCEVGRSCIIVEYSNRVIMFDCGIHPGHSGIGALPVFDGVDVNSINLCLVTHFHLDHCGAVPYLVSKTPFKGKVIMTEPTKAIAKLLWSDYATIAARGVSPMINDTEYSTLNDDALFTLDDIKICMNSISTIEFRQTIEYKELGIRVTCYAAGHVLGACMFYVEINGIKILYTGDFSREVDRHVPVADIPKSTVHILICESTYGIRLHEARAQREKRFLDSVFHTIKRSGKVLMPIFALGRVQELLLILEEYWLSHPQLWSVPIWYCSSISNKSMPVFEAFISVCGDYVRNIAEHGLNPFEFRFVKNARNIKDMKRDVLNEGQPCVVLAAPGMLQNGTSRALFELWCQDPRNTVILTGYSVRGTIADELKRNPHSLQLTRDGPNVQIKCTTEIISFSAHSDFDQTLNFINQVQPQVIFLVHGERGEMTRLSEKLKELKPNLAVFCPEILQRFSVQFPHTVKAKVIGSLAAQMDSFLMKTSTKQNHTHEQPNVLSSVFVANGVSWTSTLVSPEDLSTFVPTVTLFETRRMEFSQPLAESLMMDIQTMFEDVAYIKNRMRVHNRVDVVFVPSLKELHITWQSNPLSDLISNTIVFLAIKVVGYPQKSSLQTLKTSSEEDLFRVFYVVLNRAFDNVVCIQDKDQNQVLRVTVLMKTDPPVPSIVDVNFSNREITGLDQESINTVRRILRRVEYPLVPLPCLTDE